ncbi:MULTISPECIES: hypothetical protein [Acidovorax]|uniref:hypothetical protein n=1 Tax=Acidovorax TaxID=12916 RepID=UPI0006DC6CD2|nr:MULTISPECIES: hypothetical protein [Acidovorax]OGB08665.1 MAG: hypothetical protein A3C40_13060 [Burkholderiales bacterium RIFCSPHIGHO2_02_FULL_64_19]OGB21462.1 MAG: hypothetical protein A3E23_03830 [Burkholderiales bacterium RIFCSPHIGHO2_12_FULL_65_48]OGB56024.1 MAG: hypothetical protein A3F71_02445 [Burkholderiales bacterium RIFCSPLOWO2_12_FULL_64_33]KQB60375.1 hypothetical protein AE621_05370 [Acidovorax sp. SD340]MBO1010584.1 hypothetical protein [Acidovorax sp. SD340]
MSKSIAFLKFRSLLEQEIRTFWHVIASLEYAERWLSSASPTKLTAHPGDNRYPFKAIDISTHEFLSEQMQVSSHIRENALVSFVTAFECYLAELLERLIYLKPSLVADSDLQIPAKDLAEAVPTADIKRWLAAKVTDKYLRNKTHAAMISRLDTFCKAGVSKSMAADIEEWSRWSLVRNSIVHTSRQVTPELSKSWAARFPAAGDPVVLVNKELARIHHLALKIAEAIDVRAVSTVIHKRDELLIARELFIQRGISEANVLKATLGGVMRVTVTRIDLQKMLADQRRGKQPDGWALSMRDLANMVA